MKKNLLTYCKLKIVKGVTKKFASLLCRCVMSHLDDDSDDNRYYQYNNNCNYIYINIVN